MYVYVFNIYFTKESPYNGETKPRIRTFNLLNGLIPASHFNLLKVRLRACSHYEIAANKFGGFAKFASVTEIEVKAVYDRLLPLYRISIFEFYPSSPLYRSVFELARHSLLFCKLSPAICLFASIEYFFTFVSKKIWKSVEGVIRIYF